MPRDYQDVKLPRSYSQRVAEADLLSVAHYLRFCRLLLTLGPTLYYRLQRANRLRPRGMSRSEWRRARWRGDAPCGLSA